MALEAGIEPTLTGSKPVFLPLEDSRILVENAGIEPTLRFIFFSNRLYEIKV